jgi:AraC-like DNA-binding protein
MTDSPARGQMNQIDIQAFFGGTVLLSKRIVTAKRVQEMIVAHVTQGHYIVTTAKGSAKIGPGEVCIIPADTAVEFEHLPDARSGMMSSRWVHLRATLLGAVDISTLLDLPLKADKRQATPIASLIDEFLQHRTGTKDLRHWTGQYRIAFTLLDHVLSLAGPGTGLEHKIAGLRRLESCVAQIRSHLADPITIADITGWAHLSASRLHALFVSELGHAPMAYVRLVRMREAQRLLACTDESVASVAGQCGFVSQFHFARSFKASVGMTPTAYRREHQSRH